MVCKLKRSLYGLKQLGRIWFECVSSHLFELNFKASVHDSCLLTLTRHGYKCWIVIWVDDIFYSSTDNQFTKWFNDKISERFNIGKSGSSTRFLGISFKWDDGSLTMKHQGCVSKLLRKHGMGECKAASTPLAEKLEMTKDQIPEDGSDEQQQTLRNEHTGQVGSIAYLSLSTLHDLAFPVHLHSRFLSNPVFAHWQEAKHVLRYLRGRADVGITFMKCDDTGLNGYTDSDCASSKEDRRGITGFCFNVGSGAISWAARRQIRVATSTTEVDLHALSEAVKKAVHLRGLWTLLVNPYRRLW